MLTHACNAFLTQFWPTLRVIVSDALRWRVREIVNELLKDLPHSPINSLVSLECNLGRRPIIVEEAWLSTGYASYDFVDLNLVVSLEGDTVEVVADVCGAAARGSFLWGRSRALAVETRRRRWTPRRRNATLPRDSCDAVANPGRDAAARRATPKRDAAATPSRDAAPPPRSPPARRTRAGVTGEENIPQLTAIVKGLSFRRERLKCKIGPLSTALPGFGALQIAFARPPQTVELQAKVTALDALPVLLNLSVINRFLEHFVLEKLLANRLTWPRCVVVPTKNWSHRIGAHPRDDARWWDHDRLAAHRARVKGRLRLNVYDAKTAGALPLDGRTWRVRRADQMNRGGRPRPRRG